MIKIAAIVVTAALALPLALVGMLAGSGCLVVDVTEAGPDGMHIIVPVPIILAQAALHFVPREHTRVPCPEAAEYIPVAQRVIDELMEIPDTDLIHVEDGRDLVIISKVDDNLEVEVHGPDEDVSISLPLTALADILESFDGEAFEAPAALAALRRVSRTDLVHVRNGDETVKIWVW